MDGTGVVNTTTCAHCRREVDYSANATHFFANWCCGWQDLESGLSAYVWSVGTLPGAADIVPWTDVGLAEGASAHGLSMEHGSNVSACVYAINGVGTRSATVCSDGVVIDLTPPEMVYVTDGFEVFDIDQQSFVNSMFARFRAVDNESYVFECVLAPPPALGIVHRVLTQNACMTALVQVRVDAGDSARVRRPSPFGDVRQRQLQLCALAQLHWHP